MSGRVETTKREPESLPRLFLPKKFSPLSQTFSRDSVLQEPITLRLGTDSQSQRKSAAPRKSLTKIRNLQGESASTSEHCRTFTAQMRSLSPEQGWQLSRPHSYLEAEQAWSWDWHSAPAPLSSSPNCPCHSHGSKENKGGSPGPNRMTQQTEDRSTTFEAY